MSFNIQISSKKNNMNGCVTYHSALEVVYELEDPNRPRFTLAELKDILQERNSLKVSAVRKPREQNFFC